MGLGYELLGDGKELVVVMHDWFSDCSSYATVLPYLNREDFKYVFIDLRGYGKSKDRDGEYTLEEACNDVLNVINDLDWQRFHIVSHSMSALIAQKIAHKNSEKVKSIIAITPVSAAGSPLAEDMLVFLKGAAADNNESASQVFHTMTGERYNIAWSNFKVNNWRASSTEKARLAYLYMWSRENFAEDIKGLKTPFLVISGEFDMDAYKSVSLNKSFGAWYPNCQIELCKNAGHYPMQETPVYLASTIERYLKEHI